MSCAGCNVMTALFSAIRKAGAALSAQLALTFFVPLGLTGLAIVARMQVCVSLYQASLLQWNSCSGQRRACTGRSVLLNAQHQGQGSF